MNRQIEKPKLIDQAQDKIVIRISEAVNFAKNYPDEDEAVMLFIHEGAGFLAQMGIPLQTIKGLKVNKQTALSQLQLLKTMTDSEAVEFIIKVQKEWLNKLEVPKEIQDRIVWE